MSDEIEPAATPTHISQRSGMQAIVMGKAVISHGADGEFFVMGDLGMVVDVATLISRINAAPQEELDIRAAVTVDLIQIASSEQFQPVQNRV